MPTVSVIVPNYCHAPYLEQRIESILQQTFQDFELILLDDCSTDGSREILDTRYSPVRRSTPIKSKLSMSFPLDLHVLSL